MNDLQALNEPLSLPESRTEDEHLGLLRWLGEATQTESHCIGMQTDENGVEHEVWSHTFTSEEIAEDAIWEEALRVSSIDTRLEGLRRRINALQQKVNVYRRKRERACKIKRRQRRAAQRRHNRGMR